MHNPPSNRMSSALLAMTQQTSKNFKPKTGITVQSLTKMGFKSDFNDGNNELDEFPLQKQQQQSEKNNRIIAYSIDDEFEMESRKSATLHQPKEEEDEKEDDKMEIVATEQSTNKSSKKDTVKKTMRKINTLESRLVKRKRELEDTHTIKTTNESLLSVLTGVKVNIIYCDPPWEYSIGKYSEMVDGLDGKVINGAAEKQYPTMNIAQLKRIGIPEICAENCLIFMWTTGPHLETACVLIESWGFKVESPEVWMTWIKTLNGKRSLKKLGYHTRQLCEVILVGSKGDCSKFRSNVKAPTNVIEGDSTEHSRKPVYPRKLIDEMYQNLPKIEMFSRCITGLDWYHWGNNCELFGSDATHPRYSENRKKVIELQIEIVKSIQCDHQVEVTTPTIDGGDISLSSNYLPTSEWIESTMKSLLEVNGGISRNIVYCDPFHGDESRLKLAEKLDISSICAKDCLLFMWTTKGNIRDALNLMRIWKFEYKTLFMVWCKDGICENIENVKHTIPICEYLILGSRGVCGKYRTNHHAINIWESKASEGNVKPTGIRDLIDKMYLNIPKIELLSKSCRGMGWEYWDSENLVPLTESQELEKKKILAEQIEIAKRYEHVKRIFTSAQCIDRNNKYGTEANNQKTITSFLSPVEKKEKQ